MTTDKQRELIAELFTVGTQWNEDIVDYWLTRDNNKELLADLTIEQIIDEGNRFAQEMNEIVGYDMYNIKQDN